MWKLINKSQKEENFEKNPKERAFTLIVLVKLKNHVKFLLVALKKVELNQNLINRDCLIIRNEIYTTNAKNVYCDSKIKCKKKYYL